MVVFLKKSICALTESLREETAQEVKFPTFLWVFGSVYKKAHPNDFNEYKQYKRWTIKLQNSSRYQHMHTAVA